MHTLGTSASTLDSVVQAGGTGATMAVGRAGARGALERSLPFAPAAARTPVASVFRRGQICHTGTRIMAASDHLKALIESFASGDETRFYRTALQLAASEARQGHGKLAQELRDAVDAVKSRRGAATAPRPIPLVQPRGDLGELVTASYPDLKLTDMVLPSAVAEPLERVLRENRGQTKLREHGLHARRKLLLVGPPGTGKTMSARALAGELHLPLYLVRFESLLTKFMGETATKLRLIFDAMHSSRGVYLFDEFDAIGAQRALPNDTGEIRRILNSFLQFIELDESDSILVAATNHAEILDHALVRRFDDVVRYRLPDAVEVEAILKRTLEPFRIDDANWVELARQGTGLSCAELVRACHDAAKDAVLEDRDRLASKDVARAITVRKQAQVQVRPQP
jgi:SpoVK/Ycf46/Vps4 family AAA+-type ATPase